MSSAGQVVGGVVGAVIGFYAGGPSGALYGAQIGMGVGGVIDPPKGPRLQGPRLGDLSVQTSTYGAVIPRAYGTVALNGNVFWLENNALKEVATTSEQGGKGGGGGAEVTSYAYYATFAVGLCQGPIAGVRRIWVGSKLIYDMSAANGIEALLASYEAQSLFTIHLGTETQEADERMQATLGVADTPAYRGLAYIVFKDYPLKDHGNSLMGAQVKVEVVTAAEAAGNTEVVSYNAGAALFASEQYAGDNANFEFNKYAVGGQTLTRTSYSLIDGRLIGAFQERQAQLSEFGAAVSQLLPTTHPRVQVIQYTDGRHAIVVDGTVGAAVPVSFLFGPYVALANQPYAELPQIPSNGSRALIGARGGGEYWVISTRGIEAYATTAALTGGAGFGASRPIRAGVIAPDGKMYFSIDQPVIIETDANLNVLRYLTVPNAQAYCLSVIDGILMYGTTGFGNSLRVLDISGASPVLLATMTISAASYVRVNKWLVMIRTADSPIRNAIISFDPALATPQPADLADILTAEVTRSALLTAGDIDVTALTDTVRGYRVGSTGAIRAAIEPLQGAFPFDVVPSGYDIVFKPRGGASVATIPADLLDARAAGESPGVALTNVREMDSILPRRVVLRHLDANREYDTGEQFAERLNTDAINQADIELPLVMTGGEAAATAETLLYLYWLERYDLSFRLPPDYLHLEPGDVITVTTDDASYQVRLTAITYLADGRLECQGKLNDAAIYTAAALGEEGQSTGAGLSITGGTLYELLDLPLLSDADDRAGFPVAMTGYLAGWPGGILFRTDDGQTWQSLQGFTAPGAVMGYATNSIGAGRTDLIDKASRLTVALYSGELASVTEAAMLNGANHFAYGVHGRWEIIAAQNCVLQGDGSYVLTDLLRGRQGTEWACGLHQVNDKLILLDAARLAFVGATLDSIGLERTYRGITSGKTIDTDADRRFAYGANNLECLSPVYLNGNRHPTTNDWSLNWIRRTRVGGAWRNFVDATLGEAAESYEIDIFDGPGYGTVKRTLAASTPAAAYTSAQQVADFGANQSTLYVKVYQLSANVGRGYPLTTSITR